MYTSKTSGKSYIGMTKNEVTRKKQHKRDAKKLKYDFYMAVRKYGWDDFQYNVVYYGLDYDDLRPTEITLIAEYDTFRNGYNMTLGGAGNPIEKMSDEKRIKLKEKRKHQYDLMKKPIYQYHLDGTYITAYESVETAKSTLNVGKSIGIAAQKENIAAQGYLWSYVKKDALPPYIHTLKKRVNQYTKDNIFIMTFDCASDACDIIDSSSKTIQRNIQRVCNGNRKTAYGCIWKYVDTSDER